MVVTEEVLCSSSDNPGFYLAFACQALPRFWAQLICYVSQMALKQMDINSGSQDILYIM